VGRHRVHVDNAARQKAYRKRLAAKGLGSFSAAEGAPARGTDAQRSMNERVLATVKSLAPEIDTSALG